MFYSDTLLSKTGPLARVWLASNMERKLTKKDCLSSNLEQSIEVMTEGGSAPMALRLSGQLLLGVVRIYSRKARYLLDDCNEALLKIKMAFRPGNVDLPADQSHTVNPASLQLPDVLTELDLLAPLPDPSFLLGDAMSFGGGKNITIDWGTQSLITDTIEQGRTEKTALYDDDLDLDLADSIADVEVGRFTRPQDQWQDHTGDNTKLFDDDLDLDLGDDPLPQPTTFDQDDDMNMTDLPAFAGSETGADITATAPRPRESASPLSELGAEAERDLEQSFVQDKSFSLYETQEDSTIVKPQKSTKRQKTIQMDTTLELKSAQIREQQNDRSKILKPASFLPRDPVLLALLSMQKNGGFVSNILGDGRSYGWAPELRDVLSVEVVKRTGNLKRKRDSGVADLFSDEEQINIDVPQDDTMISAGDFGTSLHEDRGIMEQLDDETRPNIDDEGMTPPADFDDTTMPILHPADAGPISQGTRHAVHMLREHFGPEGADSSDKRQKSSVLLQDLIPEARTSRRDATKMFFEVLVLATKDAVKVEQKTDSIGGPIRLRAKRGLWGAWAEEQTSATQATQETTATAAAQA